MSEPVRRLWPVPDDRQLTETELISAYEPEPGVRVNFVTSLDGAVTVAGRSAGLSSPVDKRVFGLLRMHCDALLVGAGTLRMERYGPLRLSGSRRDWRLARGLPPHPALVVVSRSLAGLTGLPALAEAPVRPTVLTCTAAAADRRAALAPTADVVSVGATTVDLAAGLAALRDRGLTRLLCEGGPLLFGTLTAADLVDELCLTVSALLAGPGAGRITAGSPPAWSTGGPAQGGPAQGGPQPAGTAQGGPAQGGPPEGPPRGMSLRHALAAGDTLLLRYGR